MIKTIMVDTLPKIILYGATAVINVLSFNYEKKY